MSTVRPEASNLKRNHYGQMSGNLRSGIRLATLCHEFACFEKAGPYYEAATSCSQQQGTPGPAK